MQVRVGTGLDEDAVVGLWQVALGADGQRSGGARAQRFRSTLRSGRALLLVAEEEDGAPLGVLVAELRGAELEVTTVAVHPGRQRAGVGTALVQALLDRYPAVSADAPSALVGALARRGFVADGPEEGGRVRVRRAG